MAEHGAEAAVIDPNDKLGRKNRYISRIRDLNTLKTLLDYAIEGVILDFGCGSGNLSEFLDKNGFSTIGIDISRQILAYTSNHKFKKPHLFVQYDGLHLPLLPNSVSACVTFGVLNYISKGSELDFILRELFRVIEPGGLIITIEQTSRKSYFDPELFKTQRTKEEFSNFFSNSGFQKKLIKIIRYGHFPFIYLIRYGLIPEKLFSLFSMLEEAYGFVFSIPFFDYTDTLFVYQKPYDEPKKRMK